MCSLLQLLSSMYAFLNWEIYSCFLLSLSSMELRITDKNWFLSASSALSSGSSLSSDLYLGLALKGKLIMVCDLGLGLSLGLSVVSDDQ